jgi:D,D-heptose 1,7-bisphosphate phosphatase
MNRAVFLDRDGTIAKDVHYCSRVEDFQLLPTVPEAVRLLNESGFKVIVVTNQSGIARGYFTEETLAQIHQKMKNELALYGAQIDAIYYCPHHPDDGCECRKPKPKLILQAAEEHQISLNLSYVVGDMEQDVEAGKAAGCNTVLITVDAHPTQNDQLPDKITQNLLEAAKWIVEQG